MARALLQAGLEAAGRRGDLRAVGAAIRAASHPDAQVRWRAAWALARLSDPAGRDALKQLLVDEAPGVRAFAARGLGAIRDTGAAGALGLHSLDKLTSATRR